MPQGTVLGPLLFTIYTNDMANRLPGKCNVVQFGDDTALFATAATASITNLALKKDLNTASVYFEEHQFTINGQKTEYMILGTQLGNSVNAFGHSILPTQSVSYLGVEIHNKLKFD